MSVAVHVWGAVGPNADELWNRCVNCGADQGSYKDRLPCPVTVSPVDPDTARKDWETAVIKAALTDADSLNYEAFQWFPDYVGWLARALISSRDSA